MLTTPTWHQEWESVPWPIVKKAKGNNVTDRYRLYRNTFDGTHEQCPNPYAAVQVFAVGSRRDWKASGCPSSGLLCKSVIVTICCTCYSFREKWRRQDAHVQWLSEVKRRHNARLPTNSMHWWHPWLHWIIQIFHWARQYFRVLVRTDEHRQCTKDGICPTMAIMNGL